MCAGQKEKTRRKRIRSFVAEDEGFEPPQTESESGVLPLHKSSKLGTLLIILAFWKMSSIILQNYEILLKQELDTASPTKGGGKSAAPMF